MARKKQMHESKALITQALIRLLNEKPLTSISMTEIANEADVARMTLYRHFKIKEEIILHIVVTKIDDLMMQMDDHSEQKMYNLVLFRFRILKESPFTNMLYECNQLGKLFSIIRTHVMNKIPLFSHLNFDPFLLDFFMGGIDKVTETWIAEGMQTPPDEMAKRVYKLAKNINKVMN
ncbi:MAG TPA: TetR/AcrR family transcriptional regulator [Bacteroidales bacterium]|nr:TetR/AcrR family transcriptional regulator [Bacteroidales bacterium]